MSLLAQTVADLTQLLKRQGGKGGAAESVEC